MVQPEDKKMFKYANDLIASGVQVAATLGIPVASAIDVFTRIPVNADSYYLLGAMPCASDTEK